MALRHSDALIVRADIEIRTDERIAEKALTRESGPLTLWVVMDDAVL